MTSSYIRPISKGATSPINGERKDCTVRALANAANMPYLEAHQIMKEHGRLNGYGAYNNQWTPAYLKNGFVVNAVHGTTHTAQQQKTYYNMNKIPFNVQAGTSLKKFMEQNPEGTFILVNRNHTFCVIDGELIDKGILKENTYIAVSFRKI